ncbi:MAG: FAD-dependent monooxygenase [Flavobacteriales bacterium]|nr:FAD-dependent monooxygenase [Bacteroidota bacterium]MCB9240484.1 FAD-dependent monooxygenase [Flavobacteriales bacterium]
MAKRKITVVGGGLAGSLMAVYFAKRGFDVEVYERRPDMRRADIGAGKSINLALSVRGILALEKVGLKEAILENAIAMNGRMMHSENGDLSYQPYGKEGQYINSVSRGGLNVHLLELADENPNVKLFFNHRCLDVDLEKSIATFKDENGEKVTVESDYIIGGDGAFSAVRMRMMKSARLDYSQDYLDHGYKELTIPPTADGKFAMEPNALHIWPRGSYMMIALPNPDKTFTCTLFFPYSGENSFETITTPEQVMDFFNTHFPDAVPMMPTLIEDFFGNPTGSLVTVRCFPWVANKAVLLGDACHAVVPFYGQGMNCAFEDCVVMDECIEKHGDDLDAAFREYEILRKPNADAIADLALQNFIEMRDLVGDPAFLKQKEVEHDLCERYPDLFKSQYELVTFTNEPYAFAQQRGASNTQFVQQLVSEGLTNQLGDRSFIENRLRKHRGEATT